MSESTPKATFEQLKQAQKLGAVPAGEPEPPPGLNPRDIGQLPKVRTDSPPAGSDAESSASGAPSAGEQSKAESKELLPIEEWAKRLGYLPKQWLQPAAQRAGRLRAIAPLPNPKHWMYAGAVAYHRWPQGKEMTLAEFEKAIVEAHKHPIR